VVFDGGRLTLDGGLHWLAQAEAQVDAAARFAWQIRDWRSGPIRHSLETLVRQRLLQIACGYEDQNDAATLRTDPLLKLVCGRAPEDGADLASQPTLSRLENAVDRRACYRLAQALVAIYLQERERAGVARRPTSCSTWTAPTSPPTASRRAAPTMAITGSICTTRC
jgi:hypothetical protein